MVTINAPITVTATFTIIQHTLTVSDAGNGDGVVTSSPAGINCGTDCSEPYDNNTTVVLTASPGSNSTFVGWSGGGCSGTDTCSVTLTATTTVTATFRLVSRTLTVIRAGNGDGVVTSNPAGINCGPDCSETYDDGTVVVLTASPGSSSAFAGWSGAGCSGTGTCIVAVAGPTNITATFTLVQRTLTVGKAGNGDGGVTSGPAGINCGADCSEPYNHGTTVVLTANPASGSTFTGWSGGGCNSTGPCSVTLTAATTVTATFRLVVSCGLNTNASNCSNGNLPEINLGALSSTTCRTQCASAMTQSGMLSGCWIIGTNSVCVCRNGSLTTGGNRPGGACTALF